jgi:hypothetical protein
VDHAVGSIVLRRLDFDFAPPPRWPVALLWIAATGLLALAGALVTNDVPQWHALSSGRDRVADLQAQVDAMQAAQASQAASAAAPPAFSLDVRRRMALAAFDVGGVLRSIESAQVAGARLTSLDVDADSRRVELEVEVASANVAAGYLRELNAGLDKPAWSLVRVQMHGGTESALIRGEVP